MAARKVSGDPMAELRAVGLTYPGAHTKSPWPGHLDLAVKDKTFAYLSAPGEPFKISCKLPQSSEDALTLPFASPTPYGLGKSGWVTAELPAGPVPVELFKAWIDESYRAQAPKRLAASLAQRSAEQPAAAAPAKKSRRVARKKRAAQKPAMKSAPRSVAARRKPAKKAAARARRAG
ncbi:MAG TPA: MmcQ/YjbR family DNA-binding protein [Polyangiaceae bacterium]|jgi:predicted DNA-binding protein (MmcQ/YjbR family)|nr:MmcQ/YjbR family DNA-binding protein [Polyangiaceae bacterium]